MLEAAPMARFWAGWGAIHGFIAVAAGAFAAHGLKAKLTPDMLAVFETGARYQMYHALALFAVAWALGQGMRVEAAGWAFTAGIVLFSGSLYALALTGMKQLGFITPFGGLTFLAGWVLLAYRCFRS